MRRGNGGGFRLTDEGLIESVNMGADYTAEHEGGIKDLERHFGLDKTAAPGVSRRTITRVGKGLAWDDREDAGLILRELRAKDRSKGDDTKGTSYLLAYTPFGVIQMKDLSYYSQPADELPVVGAWSNADFAVHFRPEHKQYAQDLYDAFQRLDLAFLFQNVGDNPFARAGLNLVIVSRLPQEIIDDLAEKDADNDRLQAAAEATGIKARLDSFTKIGTREYSGHSGPGGYFALRPRWADDSKTTVNFWLNPTRQDEYNAGWFTVEDLDQWLDGKGPVVKSPEEIAERTQRRARG